jgi:hypothetical protein
MADQWWLPDELGLAFIIGAAVKRSHWPTSPPWHSWAVAGALLLLMGFCLAHALDRR